MTLPLVDPTLRAVAAQAAFVIRAEVPPPVKMFWGTQPQVERVYFSWRKGWTYITQDASRFASEAEARTVIACMPPGYREAASVVPWGT